MAMKFGPAIIELLRKQAPQTDGACDSCGHCLQHEGDEHESYCEWMKMQHISQSGVQSGRFQTSGPNPANQPKRRGHSLNIGFSAAIGQVIIQPDIDDDGNFVE